MSSWVLQDFAVGEIPCQLIEFDVNNRIYVMVFNRVDAARNHEVISEKTEELGIEYRPNSYEVKFDLKDNFETDNFFKRPSEMLSVVEVLRLGGLIKELLEFHYKNSNSEAYVFVAENQKLKKFYDRLANRYAEELNFKVKRELGEEGLGYEITTPNYKSTTC